MKNIIMWMSFSLIFIRNVFAEKTKDTGIDTTVFQDIKPPVNLPFNPLILIVIGIVLGLMLLIGGMVWFIKKRKKIKKKIEPPKSPEQIAYERLAELLKKNLPQDGKVKQYFIEISDILRRYVEGRFKLRAPELTTPEFLETIKKSNQLTSEHKLLLKEFLVCCDLVKFAKYGPSEKEIEDSAEIVRKFVDETKVVEQEGQNNV